MRVSLLIQVIIFAYCGVELLPRVVYQALPSHSLKELQMKYQVVTGLEIVSHIFINLFRLNFSVGACSYFFRVFFIITEKNKEQGVGVGISELCA